MPLGRLRFGDLGDGLRCRREEEMTACPGRRSACRSGDGVHVLRGEPARRAGALPDRPRQMRRAVPVDAQRAGRDDDLGIGVMLGVQREDAAWSDDEVVEVGAPAADRQVVQDEPVSGQAGEPPTDIALPGRPDAPRPLLVLDVEQTIDESAQGTLGPGMVLRALTRRRPGALEGEVTLEGDRPGLLVHER